MSFPRFLIVVAALVVIANSWVNAQAPQPAAGPPAMPTAPLAAGETPPNVLTVKTARFGSNVTLGGTVVPYKEVTFAAQVPGEIKFIAGREGDWFDAEAVLVAIDDAQLVAKRRQVLAELANANTALRNAQVQYSRELWAPRSFDSNRTGGMGMPSMFDQMFTRNFASTMGYGNPSLDRYTDLYSSGSQISQGYSGVLQAQSMLEEIDAKLKDTRSVAPFGGVIVRKLAEVGDTVQPGQPLLVFADTKYLQVQVEVPARLMPGLEKGMILPARLDVGDTRVDVRVARIFPMADVQRHTVTVKFDMPLDAPGGPGMYAEVMVPDIKAPAKNLPVVPVASLVWRGSLPAVFVVNEDNRTELRLVRLGSYLNSRTVSILSGLHEGERVLAAPPAGMVSGWAPGEAQAGSPNKPR